MKILTWDSKGQYKTVDIKAGSDLEGRGIIAVSITQEDIKQPGFFGWFQEAVSLRLLPLPIKTDISISAVPVPAEPEFKGILHSTAKEQGAEKEKKLIVDVINDEHETISIRCDSWSVTKEGCLCINNGEQCVIVFAAGKWNAIYVIKKVED